MLKLTIIPRAKRVWFVGSVLLLGGLAATLGASPLELVPDPGVISPVPIDLDGSLTGCSHHDHRSQLPDGSGMDYFCGVLAAHRLPDPISVRTGPVDRRETVMDRQVFPTLCCEMKPCDQAPMGERWIMGHYTAEKEDLVCWTVGLSASVFAETEASADALVASMTAKLGAEVGASVSRQSCKTIQGTRTFNYYSKPCYYSQWGVTRQDAEVNGTMVVRVVWTWQCSNDPDAPNGVAQHETYCDQEVDGTADRAYSYQTSGDLEYMECMPCPEGEICCGCFGGN